MRTRLSLRLARRYWSPVSTCRYQRRKKTIANSANAMKPSDRHPHRELRRDRRAAVFGLAAVDRAHALRERREAAGRVGAAPAAARVLGQRGHQPAAHERPDGQREQRVER